jgi:hypothetical protein
MDPNFEGTGLHPIFVTKHVTKIKSMCRGHMWEDFEPTYKLILYVLKNLAFSPYQLTCFLQVEWWEGGIACQYFAEIQQCGSIVQDGFAIKNSHAHKNVIVLLW